MTAYVVSFGIGVLVGALYGCAAVRSPAPPVVALVGLLGMLAGEQGVAKCRAWGSDRPHGHAEMPRATPLPRDSPTHQETRP